MNSFLKKSAIIILACALQSAFAMNEYEDADIARLKAEIEQLDYDVTYFDNEIKYIEALQKGQKVKNKNKGKVRPSLSVQNALEVFLPTSQPIIMPSNRHYNKTHDLARYMRRKFNITGINEVIKPDTGYTLLHAIFNGWVAQRYKNNGLKRPLSKLEKNKALKRSLFALWQWGGDLNNKDKEGNTALHYAARGMYTKAVKFLCDMEGVDVNVQNNEKTTPHHYMLQHNKGLINKSPLDEDLKTCYRKFINAGSKTDIENIHGESVESYVVYTQEQKDNQLSQLSRLVGSKATLSDLNRFHNFCTIEQIADKFNHLID